MVGTLTVQNLQGPTSGANANKVIIPSGQTLHAPGHVIQIVNNKGTGGSGTNATVWTGLSSVVTITPKFATSKIIVQFFATAYSANGSVKFTIGRDGVPIGDGLDDGISQMKLSGNSNPLYMPSSLSTYVSPIGSTASTEFRVFVQASTGANGYWPAGSVDQWTAYAWEIAQ